MSERLFTGTSAFFIWSFIALQSALYSQHSRAEDNLSPKVPEDPTRVVKKKTSPLPEGVVDPENPGFVPFGGCRRRFVVEGETKMADSYYRKDCENLRPYFGKSPEATLLLNDYQKTRRDVGITAYTGTLGIALLVTGLFGSQFIEDPGLKRSVRNIGLFGGLGITLGSAGYAIFTLQKNEARIEQATQHYNQSVPEERIQLQFTTDGVF